MPDSKNVQMDYRWELSSLLVLRGTIAGLIAVLLSFPGSCLAASFDCSKAASEVEKIICGDNELSSLDESLNEVYLEALKQTDSKEQTIESQRQWLKYERNVCKDAECLKIAYETRIDEVFSALSPTDMVTGTGGGADEYVLVMSKDDCVCQHMLKIYNEDLKKYGEIKYDQHEEFKAIRWEKQKSYFEVILSGKTVLDEQDTLMSKFDINNDGSPEIIIKDEHRTLRGMDSDALYIFREKDFDDFKDKIVINEDFAKKAIGAWGVDLDKNPFEGNVYWLQQLPPFEIWTTPARPGEQFKHY